MDKKIIKKKALYELLNKITKELNQMADESDKEKEEIGDGEVRGNITKHTQAGKKKWKFKSLWKRLWGRE